MKYVLIWVGLFAGTSIFAQNTKTEKLPLKDFITLHDSITSVDVVFYQGKGGSLNIEGKNTAYFDSFVENETAPRPRNLQVGHIMWQVHGREFISANFYLTDTTGTVVFNKDGKEYVNKLNNDGINFFKEQIKK